MQKEVVICCLALVLALAVMPAAFGQDFPPQPAFDMNAPPAVPPGEGVLAPVDFLTVTNITLASSVVEQGATVQGTFELASGSANFAPDLKCKVELLTGQFQTDVITEADCGTFGLSPGEKRSGSFSLSLPPALAGDFRISVSLVGLFDSIVGTDYVPLTINGQNTFININNPAIMVDTASHDPFEGVNVNPDAAFNLRLGVSNLGPAATLTPHVRIISEDKQVSEFDAAPVDVPTGDTTITIPMTAMSRPGIYVAHVILNNGGAPASAETSYKWIVYGQSANILSVTLDKDAYKTGDIAQAHVVVIGAADRETMLGPVTVEVVLSDANGEAGRGSTQIAVEYSADAVVPVQVQRTLVSPITTVRIIKDGNPLFEKAVDFKGAAPAPPVPTQTTAPTNWLAIWTAFVAVVIIAAALFLWFRRKPVAAIALLLVIPAVCACYPVPGSIERPSNKNHNSLVTLCWDHPVSGTTYNPAVNSIRYYGRYYITSCGNNMGYWNTIFLYLNNSLLGTSAQSWGGVKTFERTFALPQNMCGLNVKACVYGYTPGWAGIAEPAFRIPMQCVLVNICPSPDPAVACAGRCGKVNVNNCCGQTFNIDCSCTAPATCDPGTNTCIGPLCADPDGLNNTVRTTTTIKNQGVVVQSDTDGCYDDTTVRECACSGTEIINVSMPCDLGQHCVNGRCGNLTECSDSTDNNGNGYIDYSPPAGVRAEPGCVSPDDPDEICNPSSILPGEGASCPECNNGRDDDGDGFADYPADPGCFSPEDASEGNVAPVSQQCEPDCTYASDIICHVQCNGLNGCALQPVCDNVGLGTAVNNGLSMIACCQGLPLPSLNSDALTYITDRDRIRSSRILKTASGDSIVMQIINFK